MLDRVTRVEFRECVGDHSLKVAVIRKSHRQVAAIARDGSHRSPHSVYIHPALFARLVVAPLCHQLQPVQKANRKVSCVTHVQQSYVANGFSTLFPHVREST